MILPSGDIYLRVKVLVLAAVLLLALAACSATPTVAPITLNEGKYSALGANPKPAQPTASDLADLQSAQNGTLQQPAIIEFYSDT
jgi:hypothetical protein